jgi:5-methyltetrahydrofolate--homocysteine methyltransferase
MTFAEILASGPALSDGAWGTELQKRGVAMGECPDHWNLTQPERVGEVAASYVNAGSQVILTNTFRANRVALAQHGLDGEVAAINRAGARISREAAGDRALVFASIGPTGKMLITGEVTEEQTLAAFREQAEALAEGGANALLIETMSDLAEASLALAGARTTGLPVLVSFAFESGKNKDRTMMGVTPEQAAARMTEEGAAAVGANCGVGIAQYLPVCERLRAATKLPLWIKPNAGLPHMEDGKPAYNATPEQFAGYIPAFVSAGASFFGGCCGTGPEFVRACALALAKLCG